MAQFTGNGKQRLLSDAFREQFKYEVGNELGIIPMADQVGWSELPSKYWGRVGGKIGGRMVKVMIRHAEEALANGLLPPTQ